MASYAIAGQVAPAANTATPITPSTTKSFITSGLFIATGGNSNEGHIVSVYLVPSGETQATKHLVINAECFESNDSVTRLAGLIIPVNASLVVLSDTGLVSFTLTGTLVS